MGGEGVNKYLFRGFFPFNVVASLDFFSLRARRDIWIFFQRGGGTGSQNKFEKIKRSSGGGITTKLN